MDRFSKLYKNSAILKAKQKLSMQLSKNQEAIEINKNGGGGYMIKAGPRKNQIIGIQKVEKKKL